MCSVCNLWLKGPDNSTSSERAKHTTNNEEADDFSFYIKNSWMAHLKTWSRRKVLQNILTLMPRMTRQKEILFGSLWNLHPLANPRMLLET